MFIYETRSEAKKDATSADVVVKVCGGFVIMDAAQYRIWQKQK